MDLKEEVRKLIVRYAPDAQLAGLDLEVYLSRLWDQINQMLAQAKNLNERETREFLREVESFVKASATAEGRGSCEEAQKEADAQSQPKKKPPPPDPLDRKVVNCAGCGMETDYIAARLKGRPYCANCMYVPPKPKHGGFYGPIYDDDPSPWEEKCVREMEDFRE